MNRSTISGVIVGIVLTLSAGILGLCWFGVVSVIPAIQALGSIAIAFSAITAYRLYLLNSKRNELKDAREQSSSFLNESIALLNRAYETFTRNGTHPPSNDRLQWLSTARMTIPVSYTHLTLPTIYSV